MSAAGNPGAERDKATATFSEAELAFLLGSQRLGRLATADGTGAPHVVPVGWSYNPDLGTIDISGHNFAATRKYRNVRANPRAAFVVDDVLAPFRPRCVMVQGSAQALDAEHSGVTEAMVRIFPARSPRGVWTTMRRRRSPRPAVGTPRMRSDAMYAVVRLNSYDPNALAAAGTGWSSSTSSTQLSRAISAASSSTSKLGAGWCSTSGRARSTAPQRCRSSGPRSDGCSTRSCPARLRSSASAQ